jgi:hypothetical protein
VFWYTSLNIREKTRKIVTTRPSFNQHAAIFDQVKDGMFGERWNVPFNSAVRLVEWNIPSFTS